MPSVYVKTMGCKVNTFDSNVIQNQFKGIGYDLQLEPHHPDVTVVNTCSVTAQADREARYLARRIKREFPSTLLVFTGCYAQTDSAKLASMDEIDLVIPNEGKETILQWVEQGLKNRQSTGALSGQTGLPPADRSSEVLSTLSPGASKIPTPFKPVTENRQEHFKSSLTLFDRADSQQTRAFVKVQDGCNGFCSYCLIPYARGQSRSVPHVQVLAEIKRLIDQGIFEVVLTGIHIGDYGRDLSDSLPGSPTLPSDGDPIVPLVRDILELPGLGRLRISSLEPGELTQELLEVLGDHREKVCPHFHLPLQSGSDPILKKMRRTYLRSGYRDAVERARRVFPEVCLGADVIPGFPGETDEQSQETFDFIKDLGLSYLHVFPYSKRPNTAAAKMPGHLDKALVADRARRLRSLSRELWLSYTRRFIGATMDVLWESDRDVAGRILGRSGNYLRVAAAVDKIPGQNTDPTLTPAPGQCSRVVLKGLVSSEDGEANALSEKNAQGAVLLGRVVSP